MDNELLYSLDPVIISILFKTRNDAESLDVFNELAEGIDTVFKGTVQEYLLQNGMTEDDVKLALAAEDFNSLPPKFQPYLKNIILQNKIEANTRLFLKTYYDQLVPKLTEQERKELEEYLTQNKEIITARQEEVRAGFTLMKKILEDNGVNSYDELKEKLSKAPEKNGVPVNLGGLVSSDTSSPIAASEPTPVEVPVVEPAPVTEAPVVPEITTVTAPAVTSVIPEVTITSEAPKEEVIAPVVAPVVIDAPAPIETVIPETTAAPVAPVVTVAPENKPEDAIAAPAAEAPVAEAPAANTPPPFNWDDMVMSELQKTENAPGETMAVAQSAGSAEPSIFSGSNPVDNGTGIMQAPVAAPVVEETPVATLEQPTTVSKLDDLGVLDPAPAVPAPGMP